MLESATIIKEFKQELAELEPISGFNIVLPVEDLLGTSLNSPNPYEVAVVQYLSRKNDVLLTSSKSLQKVKKGLSAFENMAFFPVQDRDLSLYLAQTLIPALEKTFTLRNTPHKYDLSSLVFSVSKVFRHPFYERFSGLDREFFVANSIYKKVLGTDFLVFDEVENGRGDSILCPRLALPGVQSMPHIKPSSELKVIALDMPFYFFFMNPMNPIYINPRPVTAEALSHMGLVDSDDIIMACGNGSDRALNLFDRLKKTYT